MSRPAIARILIMSLAAIAVLSFRIQAAEILLTNDDFNAGTWVSNTGSSPAGWISEPPLSGNAAGNYGQTSPGTPNLTSIAAHLQDRGGNYYQQAITMSDMGAVDAGTFDSYAIDFDYAYRNDAATAGDITLRVGLWDTTTNSEIVGSDLLIADTGVIGGAGSNQFANAIINLDYDPTGLMGDDIALRFTHAGTNAGAPGSQIFNATAMFDNVSVQATQAAVPEPGSCAIWSIIALVAVGYGWRRWRRS